LNGWILRYWEITLFFQLGGEITIFFIQPWHYLWLSGSKRLAKGCKLSYKFFALEIKDKFILQSTGLYIVWEIGTNVLEEHITSIFTLKMEVVCSSNMIVHTYQTTWCHNPEDHIWIFNARKISDLLIKKKI
jgi:hypothetical protein